MKPWIRSLILGFLLSLAPAAYAGTVSISSFYCTPAQFMSGSSSTCTIYSLGSAAPAGGALITMSATGSGISIPASVTMPAGSFVTSVVVSVAASAPRQTVTITATSANTKTATVEVYHDFQILSFFCTPAVVIPGGSANCSVYMPAEAPTGGWVASLASSSPNLTVPATFNIQPRASSFRFSVTASANASVVENVNVSVTVQGASLSTVVGINPTANFYLHGNAQEVPSLTNGTVVHPAAAPAGLTGTLTVRGTGSATIEPVGNGTGLSFHPSSLDTTTNTAFINFSGAAVGQIFGTQGEITFRLKSVYNLAQRQLLPNNGLRYAFVVNDGINNPFALTIHAGGGRLSILDTVRGVTGISELPAGQEDALFGAGVTATIRIVWSVTPGGFMTNTMYWNGQVLDTTSQASPVGYNWTSQSAFAIGGSTVRQLGGGAYACDDAISEFKVISTGLVAPPTNHAPVALDQSVTTLEDTAKVITLSATDVDGDTMTYTASAPTYGTLSGTGASLTYTPPANYNGPDSFTFTANDGQLPSSPATISVTVTSVNDKPVAAFSANPTSGNVPLPVDFDAAASSDIDGTVATYAWVFGDGQTGTGAAPSHTFTTAGNYSVRLTVTDNQGGTATTQHSIAAGVAPNTPPVAQNQSVAAVEDTAKAITLVATDSDPLTYEIVTQPAHGSFTGTGANLIYHPTANYNGSDSFIFRASDGDSDSNDATVSITVSAVNDAPVASFSAAPTSGAAPLTVFLDGSGSTDVENGALSYAWDFGDGLTGTGAAVEHTYGAGHFIVSLLVTDNQNATDQATRTLTVTTGSSLGSTDVAAPTIPHGLRRK